MCANVDKKRNICKKNNNLQILFDHDQLLILKTDQSL